MTYFINCNDIDSLKATYRQLAKENHPDLGGSVEVMQKINAEYAFATAKILNGESLTAEELNNAIINNEKYRAAVEAIVALPGLVIELVGSWIWVTGNTFPAKETLKANGFYFASVKKAWYFRTEEFKIGRGGNKSLDEIKAKYGSERVNSNFKTRGALS